MMPKVRRGWTLSPVSLSSRGRQRWPFTTTCGNRVGGTNQTYPDDSLQWLVGKWWVEDEGRAVGRGRLLRAFVPHVDQQPMTLVAVGRIQPTEHQSATIRLEPLRVGAPRRSPQLPVAALPEFPGEVRTVYRARVRPVLVLSAGGPNIDQTLRAGKQLQRFSLHRSMALIQEEHVVAGALKSSNGYGTASTRNISGIACRCAALRSQSCASITSSRSAVIRMRSS